MKKRLVVFGCGYVGTAVALEALARGLHVTALTRNPSDALILREQGIETVTADVASDSWHELIAGAPDFVLNCVSAGRTDIAAYRRSYLEGMTSILAWARARGAAGTMVYTSSTSVYPQDGGVEVDEASPTTPSATERAALLLETEQRLHDATGAAARWFVLRLAGIYGPGRHHFLDQVKAGEVSGRGEQHLNLAHRDDIAAAIWSCFLAPPSVGNETLNVVDDTPARKANIAHWLASELGVAPPRFTGQAVSERRGLTPDRIISNARIRSVLGWRPRYPSFREGFRFATR